MRILLIEDEQEVAQSIKERLRQRYIIDAAYNGRTGTHLAQVCDYDLILLDLRLPDMDGLDVCRNIRAEKVHTPILVLTGEANIRDKVANLDAGADDYLTKPFDFNELLARIRALLRRSNELRSEQLVAGDLKLDIIRRTVTRNDAPIFLRRKEFDLLEYLVRNKGKVVSRDRILEHVWDDTFDSFTNVVDVHIKYLRDRIDKPFSKPLIKTIHGVGYKVDE